MPISVRYARVLAQSQPYAKHRLLAEGQLVGSPITNPNRLGAALGLAAEYQQPYFYLQGGGRFTGSAAPGGPNRIDFSPFVGGGIRAWQVLRVGAEGFLVVPLTGQSFDVGAGIAVGVEFGR